MSERIQNNSSVEELSMSEVLASLDDQYVEYDPRPRLLNSTFEELRENQIEFATELRYKTRELAELAGRGYIDTINQQLKEVGHKKGRRLLGEVVSLSGNGVIRSGIGANFSTAETTISGMVPDDDETEFITHMTGVLGYFRGISYLIGNDQYGETTGVTEGTLDEGSFYVRLHYLVQYGTCNTPFGLMPVSALGEINVSEFVFVEDDQERVIHDTLAKLLSNESMEVAGLVNDLNQVLSGPTLSDEQIRRISELTSQLHTSKELRPEDSEAILELISAYIPTIMPYAIGVSDAIEYPADTRGTESYILQGKDDALLQYDQEIKDIILAPRYAVASTSQDGVEVERTGIIPYFVLEINNAVVHIPMDRVNSFGPGTY